MSNPVVSVIVATKNGGRNFAKCLESIKCQTFPSEKVEIIVVDNDSVDGTREVARKYTEKVFNLPDVWGSGKIKNPRGAQLNFGVEKSRGEIVFFPDSDMTFAPNLLEEVVDWITNKNFDAVYVPEVIVCPGFVGKIRNFERSFYNTTCIDALRAVRRDLFLEVGGFDVKNIMFGPDDWDFTRALEKVTDRWGIIDAVLYHHEEDMTFGKYLRKKRYYMVTFDDYIKKWGRDDPDIKKQFSIWYRYFEVFTENGKWKRFFAHPVLVVVLFALRFLVGVIYLLGI